MYLSLIVIAVVVLPAPVLIKSIGKGLPPYRAVLESIITAAVGAIFIMMLAAVSQTGVFDIIMDNVRIMAQVLAREPGIVQAVGPELTESERFSLFMQIYEQAAKLFPACVCILACVSSYIEYILLSKIVKRKPGGGSARPMDKLRNFNLPRNAGIYWPGMLLVSWVMKSVEISGAELFFMNINALFSFVFCLQGMSVLFMYIYLKEAPKAIAVIVTMLFLFSGIGKLALMILGFADLVFGLKEKMS